MSFVKKIICSDGGEIRLITAKEGSEDCWFYLKISPESYKEYKSKMKSGTLDIKDYGEILFSGWGKEPLQEIKNEVEKLKNQP